MKQKTYLILAFLLFAGFGALHAQPVACSDLFFSEYIEGSSNNKCLEIYNPTSSAISLNGYQIRMYFNANITVGLTITLPTSATIAPFDVYVVCSTNTTNTGMTAQVDFTSGSSWYNGNDAVELVKSGTVIDRIGVVAQNPTNWPVGSGSTMDNTLVRKASVTQGSLSWAGSGDTEWNVFPQDNSANLGSHTSNCFVAGPCSIDAIVRIDSPGGCNNNGTPYINDDTYATTITISYTSPPTSGDLVLVINGVEKVRQPASGLSFGSFSYSTSLPADGKPLNATAQFTDASTCLLNQNLGNSQAPCSVITPCSFLFFSEYVEGSGNNKCIEIYNPTTSAINLASYGVFLSFNGGTSTSTLPLNGTIAPGGTYVLCSASANAEFTQVANQTTTASFWNGNDVIFLQDANGVIDAIGQLGNASDYGADVTLRRKSNISAGDNNPNDPFTTVEWNAYPINTSAGLGYHIGSCPTGAPAGWAFANPGCAAGSTTVASGTWTQSSNCYNPAAGADDLTFAFRELCGDGEIVAQYQGVTPFGFAGLMMRESLNPASKYVWMFMRANTNASWAIRAITGLSPTIDTRPHANRQWMKLTRTGTTFRGYLSANGTTWQLVFQSSVSLNSCVLVGLATHSNVDGTNVTSTFRNVSTSFNNNLMAMPGAAQAVDMVSEAPAMQTTVVQSGNTTESDAFGIWPNPAGSTLEVNIPMWNAGESVQLQVNDMQGRPLMYRQLGDQQQRVSLDLSTLTPGMYLLTLRSGEHLEIARFIKQ